MKLQSKFALGGTALTVGAILAGACAPKPQFLDGDGDGVPRTEDCFDDDPNTYPGAEGGAQCFVGIELGVCHEGTWQCEVTSDGPKPICTSNVINPPAEEKESRCNGLDDDCDGNYDEGCACDPGRVMMCGLGMGVCEQVQITCPEAGQWANCPAMQPSPELCNDLDDDCDGITDEEYPEENQSCEAAGSVGPCATGTWTCEEGLLHCVPSEPSPETCNGIDDDCDGETDEGFNVGSECDNGALGACKSTGYYVCKAGESTCNITNFGIPPSDETCDFQDNDCDGYIDNSKQPEICDNQDNDCDGDVDNTGLSEVCDGQDNDCDGHIDEQDDDGTDPPVDGEACRYSVDVPDITLFPLQLQNSDTEFEGHGPFVQIHVNVWCTPGAVHVEACVDMLETDANHTNASACQEVILQQPHDLLCGDSFETSYTDNDHEWDGPGEIPNGPPLVTSIECVGDTGGSDVCNDPGGTPGFCTGCNLPQQGPGPCSSCPYSCSGCVIRLGEIEVQELP